jgi:hypothetical protein
MGHGQLHAWDNSAASRHGGLDSENLSSSDQFCNAPRPASEDNIQLNEMAAAMEPEFPMYVMEASVLLSFGKLHAFQTLIRLGLVRQYNQEIDHVVFFGSHQWTADREPDHTGAQLRTLQGALRRMVAGDLGVVGDSFATHAAGASGSNKLTGHDLKLKMRSAGMKTRGSEMTQNALDL